MITPALLRPTHRRRRLTSQLLEPWNRSPRPAAEQPALLLLVAIFSKVLLFSQNLFLRRSASELIQGKDAKPACFPTIEV